MNIDKKSHKFLTLVMYVNYFISYVVIFMFNKDPLLPCFILTVNLVIHTFSHLKYYTNEGVDEKAKIMLVIQMIIVFILQYFDKSTYEFLFLFLPIGDCIYAFSYKFSAVYIAVSIGLFYPYNMMIHESTMGYPYSDVITRDIVITIFVLIILYVSRVQIVENMKYNKVLKERNKAYDKLKEYAEKIEELAVHEERSRIAYMLHNSIGHKLVAMSLSLQAEKMELVNNNILNEKNFNSVEKQMQDAMSLLRNTIENSDNFIKTLEIEDLINMLISNLQNNISVDIDCFLDEKIKIPKTYNDIIYNILLESITNSLKHSNCKNITIRIKSNSKIVINIKDNGDGFDNITDGFGITRLKKNITELGGEYKIYSENGCKVSAVLPLEEL